MKLHGNLEAKTNNGCPYGGGSYVEFDCDDIAALGKFTVWGSAAINFVARLKDGTHVWFRADKQDKENERWVRKLAKKIRVHAVSREAGWATYWLNADGTEVKE